ncbi:MAG: NAD(P)H-dependent glycerol-3-phosphate dehydrogenase [Firmicutes bacterium]|nr:NAD(P)H-dependent glycerol-3-phosphate dehydrogenase [Bacillota bacterium]
MKIAILGTGAYGIALATMFFENNCNISMWSKFDDEVKYLDNFRKSKLLDIDIPKEIYFTTNMQECVDSANLIVIAVPAQFVDDISLELKKHIKKDQHICIASKGIEKDTCLFVADVLEKHIKNKNLAIISGPSFAIDIANKVPIGLSLGTKSKETEILLKRTLENQHLKLRATDDIIGIEICGSIKNVIAIASGMLSGMGMSESTQAMFITESLHDIKELIKILGGNKNTILSFAGFGDLLLTCTSSKSRNFRFGQMIGEQRPKDEIEKFINSTTIEGLHTLESIYDLLNRKKAKIPIIDLIYSIVLGKEKPDALKKFLITKD